MSLQSMTLLFHHGYSFRKLQQTGERPSEKEVVKCCFLQSSRITRLIYLAVVWKDAIICDTDRSITLYRCGVHVFPKP